MPCQVTGPQIYLPRFFPCCARPRRVTGLAPHRFPHVHAAGVLPSITGHCWGPATSGWPYAISGSFPDSAWLGWHGEGGPCRGRFVVHLTWFCKQCWVCVGVDLKAQGRWGRVVRCLRSFPGTLAQGRTARPPAALEFVPCGRWVPKIKVRAHSHKLRAGATLSGILLTSGSVICGLLNFFFKTTVPSK